MADQPIEIPANAPAASVWRAALRREKLAARAALEPDAHARASIQVCDRLRELLSARVPGILAFCWPIRNEVDCRPLAEPLLAAGWRLAMPVVAEPAAAMRFRCWTPGMTMTQDPHGIPIPAGTAECQPDVVLLPLVAFDGAGYRLGYGGGYFDRTLAARVPRPFCIGVGFELARVASIRPAAHDVPLDCMVTEASTYFPQPP